MEVYVGEEVGGREGERRKGRVGGRKGEREMLKVNGSVDYITVSNNLHMYVCTSLDPTIPTSTLALLITRNRIAASLRNSEGVTVLPEMLREERVCKRCSQLPQCSLFHK